MVFTHYFYFSPCVISGSQSRMLFRNIQWSWRSASSHQTVL